MLAGFRSDTTRRLAIVAFGAVLLGGCSVPSNAPDAYDAQVQEDFVRGCTGDVGEFDGTTTTLVPANQCECSYQVYVDNVPYNDDAAGQPPFAGVWPEGASVFTSLDGDLTRDQNSIDKLPPPIRDLLAECAGGPTPSTSGESSTATTAS